MKRSKPLCKGRSPLHVPPPTCANKPTQSCCSIRIQQRSSDRKRFKIETRIGLLTTGVETVLSQSGRGLPQSKTPRKFESGLIGRGASWSAPVLWRFFNKVREGKCVLDVTCSVLGGNATTADRPSLDQAIPWCFHYRELSASRPRREGALVRTN